MDAENGDPPRDAPGHRRHSCNQPRLPFSCSLRPRNANPRWPVRVPGTYDPCARFQPPVRLAGMGTLVLLRHGESEWNAKGLFTGWVDVVLAAKGMQEAAAAGRMLVDAGLRPDVVH